MPRLTVSARQALTEERRQQIIAAAIKIFSAKGYERATIADIAKEAGMAEGSIYNYFKNKGDLLISLPRQIVQPRVEAFANLTKGDSPEIVLTRMALAMVEAISENGHLFRIFLSSLPSMSKKGRQQYFEQVIMFAGSVFEAYFSDLIRQGVFRQDIHPDILSLSFIGMFFPTLFINSVLQLEPPLAQSNEEVVAECVRTLLRGALASPADAKSVRPRGAVPLE